MRILDFKILSLETIKNDKKKNDNVLRILIWIRPMCTLCVWRHNDRQAV